MENAALTGELRRSTLGLVSAFVLAAAGLAAGTWMVLTGHTFEGIAILFGDGGGFAGLFVYGTERRRAERRERMSALMAPRS